MPPALHPRSRLTTSLFTTTLAVSFLVVGAPHILPCPVPSRAYTEGEFPDPNDPTKRRRRRRKVPSEPEVEASEDVAESMTLDKRKRECPVPKPSGLIGQVLGFDQAEKVERPVVRVEALPRKTIEKKPS
ncbi:hypothetical protein LTS18_005172 [Coniosporium uncinatum]|uniref:Uncharacterized protein n=1 Tax=Coniosporium uncinatum TaxID=93489 RepID=A0ACC3D4X5_9PEZI|nr:hypothetical protein LTS18_005172 [Coniosporium uncinatum]